MEQRSRAAVYDGDLDIEALRFAGRVPSFPGHFHDYYVTGLVEDGERRLSCAGREHPIGAGSILLFHPGDSHACTQSGGDFFGYRALHIARDVMLALTETERRELPGFSQNVLWDKDLLRSLRRLHRMIAEGAPGPAKEEQLLLLLSLLTRRYGQAGGGPPVCRQEVERACAFIRENYPERIGLDQISRSAGLSKSALLRAFLQEKGVTPYRYLEAVRIGAAKALLRRGVPPAETALRTGFSDQSHFTNAFRGLIGLPPGAYRGIFSDRKAAGDTAGRGLGAAGAQSGKGV